jgi:hypothetical protein
MTIYAIYDQSIKQLPLDERRNLARLILDEVGEEPRMTRAEAETRLGELVQQALDSGPPVPLTEDVWDKIRLEGQDRAAHRRGAGLA